MLKKSRKYVNKINNSRVYDVAIRSPITKAENLSSNLKNKIFLKREDLQPTHSFKIRGAYNKISHLVNKDNVNHRFRWKPCARRCLLSKKIKN